MGEPLDKVLSVRPTLGDTWEDYKVYLQLYHDVSEGKPYYDSVLAIFRADPNRGNQPPPGVVGYRLPTIYYLWRAVPRAGRPAPGVPAVGGHRGGVVASSWPRS